jgi:hypothetical protein
VKKLPPEDEIKARLRELTEDSRRVREELQRMIQRSGDRSRAFGDQRLRAAISDDRSDRLTRGKSTRTKKR